MPTYKALTSKEKERKKISRQYYYFFDKRKLVDNM